MVFPEIGSREMPILAFCTFSILKNVCVDAFSTMSELAQMFEQNFAALLSFYLQIYWP